jgi:hypothetical protein
MSRTQFAPVGALRQALDDVPARELTVDYPGAISEGDQIAMPRDLTATVIRVVHYPWGSDTVEPFRYVVVTQ